MCNSCFDMLKQLESRRTPDLEFWKKNMNVWNNNRRRTAILRGERCSALTFFVEIKGQNIEELIGAYHLIACSWSSLVESDEGSICPSGTEAVVFKIWQKHFIGLSLGGINIIEFQFYKSVKLHHVCDWMTENAKVRFI